MSKSILIHENGGPEKMQLEDVEVGKPGPGQVKIKHTAIGLNFIDIYTRSGLYPTQMPHAVGREAAGVIRKRSLGSSGSYSNFSTCFQVRRS